MFIKSFEFKSIIKYSIEIEKSLIIEFPWAKQDLIAESDALFGKYVKVVTLGDMHIFSSC